MFPCFFGGFLSRLVSRPASAAISLARVWRGRITSSMKPRAAATYGLANFSRNSAIRAARARRRIRGLFDLALVEDVHRAFGTHDRDLGAPARRSSTSVRMCLLDITQYAPP